MKESTIKIRLRHPRHALARTAAAALVAGLCLSGATPKVKADTGTPMEGYRSALIADESDGRYVGDHGTVSYNLPGIPSRNPSAYTRHTAYVGSTRLSVSGLTVNGITYLPLRATVNAIPGLKMTYSSVTKTATVSGEGLIMTAADGGYVTYANGRALFSFSPTIVMNDGRMYLPASAITRAIGMSFSLSDGQIRVTGQLRPITEASKFYREDEVFWLARIIHAESAGEPLLGQMAVGNVILNRVRSGEYPNTIYGVIFDRRYGVQFSPILNGSIYNDPSYTSRLAAMICLEGTLLSEDVLFFLNPVASQSSWIVKNREYAYTILNHDFYR